MDHAIVLFTPYSVQEALVGPIMQLILKSTKSRQLFKGKITLTAHDVEMLYPQMTKHPLFPSITNCFVMGESVYVALAGQGLHQILKPLKGTFRYENGIAKATGLRALFQKDTSSFEFLFHTTDSNTEFDEIVCHLLKVR